ncbi:hypothetical protein QTI66_13370 [Variovorax sp. J22R133]|uniref:hypothetical protein n=1 Tax=Variovorax brevis TaxID=3053503 RepID=UPI00257642AE|nr:hypothetical protein [Variovorax sp. J22R133]MDM0113143.1 hypothetical protein [Variovorax sp. J22R133]
MPMLNFVLRVILFVMGLVFAASLAFAVLVLAALWMMGAAWARLTGRPVRPWAARFNPASGFDRFRAAARPAAPSAADVANARARGQSVSSPVAAEVVDDVTDVRAKPVSGSK